MGHRPNAYLFGMLVGLGKPLRFICVGGRKPDGRVIFPAERFARTLEATEIGCDAGTNVTFKVDCSWSGLFKLPLELADDRLCRTSKEINKVSLK